MEPCYLGEPVKPGTKRKKRSAFRRNTLGGSFETRGPEGTSEAGNAETDAATLRWMRLAPRIYRRSAAADRPISRRRANRLVWPAGRSRPERTGSGTAAGFLFRSSPLPRQATRFAHPKKSERQESKLGSAYPNLVCVPRSAIGGAGAWTFEKSAKAVPAMKMAATPSA